MEALLSSLYIV